MWQDILKRGIKIKNEAEYNSASLDERRRWHRNQNNGYYRRLKALQKKYTDVDLTDVENPIYKEMKEYQFMANFHSRQEIRLRRCVSSGKTECNDYYSPELEGDNRKKLKLRTTPTGKLDPYVELSLEAYNNLTTEQKRKYHRSMYSYGNKDAKFHARMDSRLKKEPNTKTFPSPEHGGESKYIRSVELTKDEYNASDRDGKLRYHRNQKYRNRDNKELLNFHGKMVYRLERNSSRPIYYSLEDEKKGESK